MHFTPRHRLPTSVYTPNCIKRLTLDGERRFAIRRHAAQPLKHKSNEGWPGAHFSTARPAPAHLAPAE